MNSKTKFLLYLIVSEVLIGLNDQNYVTALTLEKRRSSIGRSNPLQQPVQSLVEDPSTTEITTESTTEITTEPTTTTGSSSTEESTTASVGSPPIINRKVNGNQQLIDKFHQIEKRLKEKAENPDFSWINVFEKEGVGMRTPIIDKFTDENYVVFAASHGHHFKPYAKAHIFMDQFDHFLKFKIPKQPILTRTKINCEDFYQKIYRGKITSSGFNITTGIASEALKTMGSSFCMDYMSVFNFSVEEMQEILDNAYNSFKTRTIKKRFVGGLVAGGFAGAVTGAIAGAAAGYITAKHFLGSIDLRVQYLEAGMGGLKEATRTNSEQLIGLSKKLVSFESQVNEKFKITEKNLNKQIDILDSTIMILANNMDMNQKMNYFKEAIQQYVSHHLNSQRNLMILELENLNTWEEIFTVLVNSKLPVKLVNYNQLKSILNEIKGTLPRGFEFGIEDNEFLLYFILPLVSFGIENNEENYDLIVYLKLPLN